jgi:hypothetical protein
VPRSAEESQTSPESRKSDDEKQANKPSSKTKEDQVLEVVYGKSSKDGPSSESGSDSTSEEKSEQKSEGKEEDVSTQEKEKSEEGEKSNVVTTQEDDEEEEQEEDVPIKEILTTTPIKADHHEHKKHKRRGPKYLDDETMTVVRKYLAEGNATNCPLDENEVVAFMLRTSKVADQHASHQMSLMGDSDSDDSSIFEECLADEEDHALGHELFRSMVAAIEKQYEDEKKAKKLTPKKKELHKKTLGWIKRAAGLHRSHDEGAAIRDFGRTDSRGDGKGRISTRRHTRKAARDFRIKKREKGLDVLGAALHDLEGEYGPFPKLERLKKRPKEAEYDADEEDAGRRKRKGRSDDENSRKKRRSGDENVSATDACTCISGSLLCFATKPSSSQVAPNRRTLKKSRSILPKQHKEKRKKKVCTNLRLLDWTWRSRTSLSRKEPTAETEADYLARKSIVLHPEFQQAGIVHRLPRWNYFQPNSFVDHRRYDSDPPRRRHSDRQYAEFCSELMHCLKGRARLFATCEFFYSDLDREW